MKTIASMRLLGGRPSLDLVNTVDARKDTWGPDLLVRYDDLIVWATRVGLLDAGEDDEARAAAAEDPKAAATALQRIQMVREAIAAVLEALIQRGSPPQPEANQLGQAVDDARRHQRLVVSGRQMRWNWAGEPPLDRILYRVALDAAAIVTDDVLRSRIRLCPGPNCGWLFVDETKNRSRRWCRDGGCGAQMRVLRYRAKS